MARFLTTIELSYHILQILKSANREIILITPYLKLSDILKENLSEANKKGIEITLVYGKSELAKEEEQFLNTLENLNIYYYLNLHGKCYFNESVMLLTSMNLIEYSEKKNKEFGIIMNAQEDYLFEEALEEMRLLISGSQLKKKSKSYSKGFVSFVVKKPIFQHFCDFLNESYGEKKFTVLKTENSFGNRSTLTVSQDFIKNVNIEVGYNIDVVLNVQPSICQTVFNASRILSHPELTSKYRVYWNPPHNVIKVYMSIEYRDKWDILEDQQKFMYYKQAIDLVISELKEDFSDLIEKE